MNNLHNSASKGDLENIKQLYKDGCIKFSEDILIIASENYHLNVVKWLHENCKECRIDVTITHFVSKGNLQVLKWLYENFKEYFSERIVNLAAINCHLPIIKWVHESGLDNCFTECAMDSANNLEIIKWLHENRTEGCTHHSLIRALEKEDFETVKWLKDNRQEIKIWLWKQRYNVE